MSDANLKLSYEAKQVFDAAFSFTRFFGDEQVTVEHLLLSLLKTPHCDASLNLTKLGIEPHRLGDKLREEINVTKTEAFSTETISKSAQVKALELLAQEEAEKLNSELITTLHLLRAILESPNLQANKWLQYHGINLDKLQNMPATTRERDNSQAQNWDYFSGPAKAILANAQMVATHYKQDIVTTSHILLGILQTPESNAYKQLSNLIDDLETLSLNLTREISSYRESSLSSSKINLSDDLKIMLTSAARASRQVAFLDCIDSRLLLLGIVEQEKTPAAQFLAKSYVTFEQLRDQPQFVREYPSKHPTERQEKRSFISVLLRWFKRE